MQTAEVVAFSESLNLINKIGFENIQAHEKEVLNYGIEKLSKNNSVKINIALIDINRLEFVYERFMPPMEKFFIASLEATTWTPSFHLLYFILLVGALLTAGVALSALSFYEDFYWNDKNFREKLRLNPSRRTNTESNG